MSRPREGARSSGLRSEFSLVSGARASFFELSGEEGGGELFRSSTHGVYPGAQRPRDVPVAVP
jgi:hypothetical protein